MTFEWTETITVLKFRIGELTLFSVRFPCLALMTHFTKLGCDPMHPRPPFERFKSGVEVMMIQAHPVEERLALLTRLPEAIRYVPDQYRNYYTTLESSFDTYLKGFSAKSRSTLQRKVRKFTEASGGKVNWREYALVGEMQEFHTLAREVSRKTYQERLLDAGLPEDPQFLRHAQEMAANGEARGYILFLNEQPIAYIFCPIVQKAFLYQYVGYDPECNKLSPGTVLQYLVLEKLMSEGGFSMFDFTEGEGQHKKFFATSSVLCANILYFRPTLRNRTLFYLHALTGSFCNVAVAMLDRIGLKARIKKLLRTVA